MENRERAFAHELSHGVTRFRGRLDHLLAPHVHRGLPSVDPVLLEVLRLGAYQILYMDGVPGYAAVSETVDQVKSAVDPKVSGFANAVLRKVLHAGDDAARFPSMESDPVAHLATWGSHPEWLVRRWLERWSPEEVQRLVEANNRRPDVFVVPLDGPLDDAVRRLADEDIGASIVGSGPRCLGL